MPACPHFLHAEVLFLIYKDATLSAHLPASSLFHGIIPYIAGQSPVHSCMYSLYAGSSFFDSRGTLPVILLFPSPVQYLRFFCRAIFHLPFRRRPPYPFLSSHSCSFRRSLIFPLFLSVSPSDCSNSLDLRQVMLKTACFFKIRLVKVLSVRRKALPLQPLSEKPGAS